jgi:cytosine/adenosine deaminase-related metal-dependent hydrolase
MERSCEEAEVQPRWYYDVTDDEAAGVLAQLAGRGRRVLLRGATVVTLDPDIGDFSAGDVLIADGRIEAVGPDLGAATDAVTIELRGMIVMPGLVEAHRHCWQNQFRRLIADATLFDYAATTHAGMAQSYEPEDIYAGCIASALAMLDGGVTSVLDFCHNSRTGAHSDAAFRAYRDAGMRAVHIHAPPSVGEWDHQWPADIERLDAAYCQGPGSLTSVRLGVDVTMTGRPSLAELVHFARERGFGVTMDAIIGTVASAEIEDLAAADALGPDVTLIHCTDLTDEAWRLIASSGTRVTLATTSDQQIGIGSGRPPIQTVLDLGLRPSLSADVEIALAGDMFTQMRATLATQRMQVSTRVYLGESGTPGFISNRDVLEFATIEGARAIGLADRIGTLTPGKDADLIAIRAEDVNNLPLNNAVGTIVQGTDSRNIDVVMVAGEVRKWRGQLVGADIASVRRLVHASRDRIAGLVGFDLDPIHPKGGQALEGEFGAGLAARLGETLSGGH